MSKNISYPWDVYASELFRRGHGYPLWDPQPTKHGQVLIGDVGYLDKGAFYRIFNAMRSREDSVNRYGVPNDESYKPLTLQADFALNERPSVLPAGLPLCSMSVKSISLSAQAGAQNVSAGVQFQCSDERGALLVIKDSADRTEHHRSRRMMNFMKTNIESWHTFVDEKLDMPLEREEIIFVKGMVKTNDWAVAAFMQGGRSAALQLQADVGSTANAAFTFTSTTGTTDSAVWNVGPSVGSHSSTYSQPVASTPQASSASLASEKSQSIFISYFKMKKRRFWFSKIEAAAGPHSLAGHDDLEEVGAIMDTEGASDVEQVPDIPKAYDPVDYLLDYIFEQSEAELAVASDTDITDLCPGEDLPADIPAFLAEKQPLVEVSEDGLGMLVFDDAAAMAIPDSSEGQIDVDPASGTGPGGGSLTEDMNKMIEEQLGARDARVVLESHTGGVCALAYSPDGLYVASGSEDMNVIIWDVVTRQRHATCVAHSDTVCALAFSPNGQELVSGARDGKAIIWTVATGVPVKILEGHEGFVYSLAWSPDGSTIVTASLDYTISWWDASTYELTRRSMEHDAMILLVAFSPDGRRLISAGADQSACIWDSASGTLLNRLIGHEGMIYTAAFDNESRRVVTGSEDGTARIWSSDTGEEFVILREHAGAVWAVTFTEDGRRVLSAASDGTVRVCDSYSGDRIQTIDDPDSVVNSAAFSQDCRRVCTSSGDNTIKVWDTTTGQHLATLEGHSDKVNNLRFSPDGARIASSSDDTTIRLWNLRALNVA